jgi:hypothetical protein
VKASQACDQQRPRSRTVLVLQTLPGRNHSKNDLNVGSCARRSFSETDLTRRHGQFPNFWSKKGSRLTNTGRHSKVGKVCNILLLHAMPVVCIQVVVALPKPLRRLGVVQAERVVVSSHKLHDRVSNQWSSRRSKAGQVLGNYSWTLHQLEK